jgi:hypothetical protein
MGYAKTIPWTFQSDYGIRAADSLGIHGINVTDFTTGLPNISIPDLTGISGGPAFLPVNPKQFHWQVEDALVWMRGKHQLKFGYRLVDRYPSPFTNTDTRGTINFGRNYTNNPVTNTGGSGIASLLTGYINSAARGFLLEPYTLRTQEHGMFVQDDFKASPRLTINAGLRYEIFRAETEEDNKIVNFDPVNLRLIYAGEDGASNSVNKKTDYGNFAPRLGLTYDLFGNGSTILRTGFAITYYPEQPSASNMIGQQVPYTISQNVSFATNPTDFSTVRTIADPFPAIVQVKPRTTEDLQAANPRVLGHSFENETPYAEQWHLGIDRRLFAATALELSYAGSAGKHIVFCYNPNEISRESDPGIAQVDPAAQSAEQHATVRSEEQLQLSQRTAEDHPAFPQRAAASRELHVREVAGLWRVRGERRRRGGQSSDRHEPQGGIRSIRVRRAPSRRGQLGLRAAVGTQPALDARGRHSRRNRRRLAACRDRDDDDGPAVHGVHADRREQRRAELAEPDRIRGAGQPERISGGTTLPTQGAGSPIPTETQAAASSTGRGT